MKKDSMKAIFIFLLTLLLFSCKQVTMEKKETIDLSKALLPESEKRRILHDSIIWGDMVFPQNYRAYQEFYWKYYPEDSSLLSNYKYIATELYIANEPLIHPNRINNNNKWFRMYLYPCFYNPFLLKIEQNNRKEYFITYKLLDIDDQKPSRVLFEYSYSPDDTLECYQFFKYLDDINFLNNNNAYPKCSLSDGNHWTFEYINNKQYKSIYRADPEIDYCGSKEEYQLALNCLNMIKKSRFFDVLKKDFNDGEGSPYNYLKMYPEKLPTE